MNIYRMNRRVRKGYSGKEVIVEAIVNALRKVSSEGDALVTRKEKE